MTLLDACLVIASLGVLWVSALAFFGRMSWHLQPSTPLATSSAVVPIAGLALAAVALSDPLHPIGSPHPWLHQWSPGLLALALTAAFSWVPLHLLPPGTQAPPAPLPEETPAQRKPSIQALLGTVDRAHDIGALGDIARVYLRDFHGIEEADRRTSAELVRATEAHLGVEASKTLAAFFQTVDRSMYGGGRASPSRLSEVLRDFIRTNASRELASPPSER